MILSYPPLCVNSEEYTAQYEHTIYIDENKKRPSLSSKNNNEKQLGNWLSHQTTNYKNKNKGKKYAIDNLINNAFSYSNGEVLITLKKNKDSITISILDDGPGIPAEEIKRLLKPFERMDEARGNSEGCGLGLAIAERITQSHDGKLTISNRAKKGLEVKIVLPLVSES